MHPAILWLAETASTTSTPTVEIALIGGLALVIAALIPALFSLRERIPRDLSNAPAEVDRLEAKIHELERFIWRLGYDPDKKKPLREGDEDG